MSKHRRRKLNRMGREFKKPSDIRRSGETVQVRMDEFAVIKPNDGLSKLAYSTLRRKGKIKEQITNRGKTRYNIVIDGNPRTITLEKTS